jgi:hypothetical protein
MSLDVWLKRGKTVNVGGRDLVMLPLPVTRLFKVMYWLEENANDVIRDTIQTTEPGKVPNPMVLVTRVLAKVDMSQVIFDVLIYPKNPDTKKPINEGLTKEFVEEYLDIPTANALVKAFVQLNEIEDIIKNLQSLPVVKKLMEAASLTFGIPYLSSLQQSTGSAQTQSEGSRSLKSTDTLEPDIIEKQGLGKPSPEKPTLLQ